MPATVPLMMSTQLPNITLPEAAKILKVSWKTVNRWVKSGQLPAVKIGGRYRTTEEWIQSLIQSVASVESHERKRGSKNGNGNEETARRNLVAKWGLKKVSCP